MTNITLPDRIVSAVMGAIFGALIGFILAWLFGVYSQTMAPSNISINITKWVGIGSLVFCLLGFIIGEHVGGLIGSALNLLFQFEDQRNYEIGVPFLLFIFVLMFFGGWLWFNH